MAEGAKPAPLPQPEIQPPQLPVPQAGVSYSVSQVTQVNQHIPPLVWTPETFDKYMTLLKQEGDDIRRSMDGFQKREHGLWVFGMSAVVLIVATGLFFTAKGITGGQQIILGTLSFAAGLLAGRKLK